MWKSRSKDVRKPVETADLADPRDSVDEASMGLLPFSLPCLLYSTAITGNVRYLYDLRNPDGLVPRFHLELHQRRGQITHPSLHHPPLAARSASTYRSCAISTNIGLCRSLSTTSSRAVRVKCLRQQARWF